mgnify:CR=1 FL=1
MTSPSKKAEDRDELLSKMVDRIESTENQVEFKRVLRDAMDRYDLKSLAFMGFNISNFHKSEPELLVTYSNEWVTHYRSKEYFDIDPVVHQGLRSIIPVDWASFDRSHPRVKKLFSESRDAGLGNQGLSIRVRGRNGDMSLFSLTCETPSREWDKMKRSFLRDFQTLAVYFHQSVKRSFAKNTSEFMLTPRELECIYWAACGKTSDETASIIGISRRGVRFHIENAIFKLNATNVSHAVAKAVQFQIINPPK